MKTISVVNMSSIGDTKVQRVIRAVNNQLVDFANAWDIYAKCVLEGRRGNKPNMNRMPELRGKGIIYLLDKANEDALGWHDANLYGVPYGVVDVSLSDRLGEDWSVTFSHEVLELALDPNVNRLVAGPHPDLRQARTVLHWYEACDAVQSMIYEIDGVLLSDFLLPLYFTVEEEKGSRISYLGADIYSFGVAPGGYIGFFDPELMEHTTYFAKEDNIAAKRAETKGTSNARRRSLRYKTLLNSLT